MPDKNTTNVDQINAAIGARIRQRRRYLGISLSVAAERAGIDRSHIQRIETGNGNPSVKTLCDIASALEIDPVSLVADNMHTESDAFCGKPVTEREVVVGHAIIAIVDALTVIAEKMKREYSDVATDPAREMATHNAIIDTFPSLQNDGTGV